jgi:hypothetical protein
MQIPEFAGTVPILRAQEHCNQWMSTLKIDTVCFPETLVSAYKFTRSCSLEDQHGNFHRRENFRSHTVVDVIINL